MIQPRVWLRCFSSRLSAVQAGSFAMKFLAAFAIGIPMAKEIAAA